MNLKYMEEFIITNPYKKYIFIISIIIFFIIFFILFFSTICSSVFIYFLNDMNDNNLKDLLGSNIYKNFYYNLCSNGLFNLKKDINGNILGISNFYKVVILIIYVMTIIYLLNILTKLYIYLIIAYNVCYSNLNDTTYMSNNIIIKGVLNKKNIILYVFKYVIILIFLLLPIMLILYQTKIKKMSLTSFFILFIIILPLILVRILFKNNIINDLYNILDKSDYKWIDNIIKYINNYLNYSYIIIFIYLISVFYLFYFKYINNNKLFAFSFIFINTLILLLYLSIGSTNIILNCYDNETKCNILKDGSLYDINNNLRKNGVSNLYQAIIKYNFPCFYKK